MTLMRRSKRLIEEIDYKEYHRSGEKILKAVVPDEIVISEPEEVVVRKPELLVADSEVASKDTLKMSDGNGDDVNTSDIMQKVKDITLDRGKMALDLVALSDDIDDFLDENPVEEISDSLADLDAAIKRVEEFRTIYRSRLTVQV